MERLTRRAPQHLKRSLRDGHTTADCAQRTVSLCAGATRPAIMRSTRRPRPPSAASRAGTSTRAPSGGIIRMPSAGGLTRMARLACRPAARSTARSRPAASTRARSAARMAVPIAGAAARALLRPPRGSARSRPAGRTPAPFGNRMAVPSAGATTRTANPPRRRTAPHMSRSPPVTLTRARSTSTDQSSAGARIIIIRRTCRAAITPRSRRTSESTRAH